MAGILAEGKAAKPKQRQRTQRKSTPSSCKAPKQLLDKTKRALLLDPGWSDILHRVFHISNPKDPKNGERFRLTHRQEVVQHRVQRFKQTEQKVKRQFQDGAVQAVEKRLAKVSCRTLNAA
ncbi:hypothetical protein H4R19_004332 [Coemansia spiralis]|nr:hypothetical protein H4R19_004332 [Coemansia spiralis]